MVNSVGVADGGNQIMVGEGGGVSEGRGVSVDGVESNDVQEVRIIIIARRVEMRSIEIPTKQSVLRLGDCFVANAPRNGKNCMLFIRNDDNLRNEFVSRCCTITLNILAHKETL